ncbi:hypothetical protein SD71_13855 [Cohnella kolymensis]|uniref:DUF4139 domain-containing protein n=1 Tax=Cohnella kolymensis TaxID=1590652 RepID=A0ABR5A369_9BACL|nr:hypothetical protein SD71_13855 [Cohnella kolymensis]
MTSSIKAEVKSVLNEQTAEGTRLGAVIRLYNESIRTVRVPDYEVRLKSHDGIEFTLRPSVSNARAILPKQKVELSYLIQMDHKENVSLKRISWFDVDEYVYPKRQKEVLTFLISSLEWKGANAIITNPGRVKQWGQSFTIPTLSPSIQVLPINIMVQNTQKSPVAVVTFLVENVGDWEQSVQDFRVDGKVGRKVYSGKRVEQGTMSLDAGEAVYLHYAIPLGLQTKLTSLNILTSETFKPDAETTINYAIGRLNVEVPADGGSTRFMDQLRSYENSTPISFDNLNKLIAPELKISMEALQIHESEGGGFKAVVAKYKLYNDGIHSRVVPNFQVEMLNAEGKSYMGTRQTDTVETLAPKVGYVVYYSFVVPPTEDGQPLAMNILDGETAAPYFVPIASYRTQVVPQTYDDIMKFYPFNVSIQKWSIEKRSTGTGDITSPPTYTFKLNLNLDIELKDKVTVDNHFPKMKVELTDEDDKVIGSQLLSFTGENRLISGQRVISVNSENYISRVKANIYEVIDTPFGEAKRLVLQLKE